MPLDAVKWIICSCASEISPLCASVCHLQGSPYSGPSPSQYPSAVVAIPSKPGLFLLDWPSRRSILSVTVSGLSNNYISDCKESVCFALSDFILSTSFCVRCRLVFISCNSLVNASSQMFFESVMILMKSLKLSCCCRNRAVSISFCCFSKLDTCVSDRHSS